MTPADLAAVIRAALVAVLGDRGIDTSVVPEAVTVERPRNPEHGDYATNIALQLGKKVGVAPRDLASELATALEQDPGIDMAEIAGRDSSTSVLTRVHRAPWCRRCSRRATTTATENCSPVAG